MDDLVTSKVGIGARLWAWVTGKGLPTTVLVDADDFVAPSAVPGTVVTPAYDPEKSLSAYAAFAWVRASITAKTEDLEALPRYVLVGTGEDVERYDDHPVLDLLANPNPRMDGVVFNRQRMVDYFASGNAMRAVAGVETGEPVSLHRLHPDTWNPELDAHGGIESWQGPTAGASFPGDHVLHDRMPSWEAGPRAVLGESPIRSLDRELTTTMNATKLAARLSASGQPQTLLSRAPRKEGDPVPPNLTREKKAAYRRSFETALGQSNSGTAIIDSGWVVQKLGFSPKEIEYEKTLLMGRDSTVAVMGVAPTRVGIPTANYATAREGMKVHWRARMGEAVVFDSTDTQLARMFTNWARANLGGAWQQKLKTLRVVTDFSGVEVLQESRTERLQRVQTHILNFVSPADAYAEEGFEELAAKLRGTITAPVVDDDEEVEEVKVAVNGGRGLTLFRKAPELVPEPEQEEPTEDEREATRAAQWRDFIERTHKPTERLLQHAMQAALQEQARVLADRIPDLLADVERGMYTRQLTTDEVASVLRIAESMGILRDAALESIRKALEKGLNAALAAFKLGDTPLDERRLLALLDSRLGEMVRNVSPETINRVRQVVVDGLAEGVSTNEIQAALMQDVAFNASRALRIARTETTTALEEGASLGYDDAAKAGVKFELEWLTARDPSVRESHRPMDRQTQPPGGQFTSGAGHKTTAPGAFGIAAEDIQCRCTRVPKIIEEP